MRALALGLMLGFVAVCGANADPQAKPAPACTFPDRVEVSFSITALGAIDAALQGTDHSYQAHLQALKELAEIKLTLQKRYCK